MCESCKVFESNPNFKADTSSDFTSSLIPLMPLIQVEFNLMPKKLRSLKLLDEQVYALSTFLIKFRYIY